MSLSDAINPDVPATFYLLSLDGDAGILAVTASLHYCRGRLNQAEHHLVVTPAGPLQRKLWYVTHRRQRGHSRPG